jgi:tyrosine-protein kinase Etk/Wzc
MLKVEKINPAIPEEVNFFDLLKVLNRYRAMIFKAMAITAMASALVVFIMPKTFTGIATILPPQSPASQIGGQLGMLAGLAGLASGAKKNSELYVSMLKSQRIADQMIARFDLKQVYDKDFMADTREELEKTTRILLGKEGLIRVEVDDRKPERAAEMADAYVEELAELTQTLAVTDASRRRLFFEKQLKQTQEELAKAELAMQQIQESSGLIQPEGQAQVIIVTIAQLKAKIAVKEVEIGTIQTFATGRNSELQLARNELAGMKEQLLKLEKSDPQGGSMLLSGGSLPAAGLEYVRRLRDVKYQEAVFEAMAKQYELAKIDEARDHALIQQLDKAEIPEKKSAPKRLLIIMLSTMLAGVAAVAAALFMDARERARRPKPT